MSYQTSSKRSPPFWLLIGARKLVFFWHQSEARTAATVWNWSGKTLSPGALLAVLYFSSCHIFFHPFRPFLVPTICPWVSEDVLSLTLEPGNKSLVHFFTIRESKNSKQKMDGILGDTVSYGTALTWTLQCLPQPEIKFTRRIHLEIRFNLT